MMIGIELKPCPFCGGEVSIFKDNHNKYAIKCFNCRMYFGIEVEHDCELEEGWYSTFDTVDGAKEAWNRRAENMCMPAADVRPERHGHWIEEGDIQICSECGEEHSWQDYRASYCEDCGAKMDGKDGGNND